MNSVVLIKWKGLSLYIHGEFVKGEYGNDINPEIKDSFEIEHIFWGRSDIHEVFIALDVDMWEIKKLVMEKIK